MWTRGMDEEKLAQNEAMLVSPLPGEVTPTALEAQDEGEAFMALYAAVSGGSV